MSEKAEKISEEANTRNRSNKGGLKSPLATYFLTVLLSFGVASLLLNSLLSNSHPVHGEFGMGGDAGLKIHLQQSLKYPNEQSASERDEEMTNDGTGTGHSLAGLDCTRYGGPDDTSDFVYWEDIPQDSQHISPFHRKRKGHTNRDEYLTFEPDSGGKVLVCGSFTTTIVSFVGVNADINICQQGGIIFVWVWKQSWLWLLQWGELWYCHPKKRSVPFCSTACGTEDVDSQGYLFAKQLYLLSKKKRTRHGDTQKTAFSFADFFHMDAIHDEHAGLDIITMEEFLEREVMAGKFHDPKTDQVVFPPGNRTDWNGEPSVIFEFMRKYSREVVWQPEKCLAVFPADSTDEAINEIKGIFQKMLHDDPKFEQYVGKPVPVDAPPLERLKESRSGRNEMCLYDQDLQRSPYLHFPVDHKLKARLLVNPYQFLFFQDYREDLWMKRFIR